MPMHSILKEITYFHTNEINEPASLPRSVEFNENSNSFSSSNSGLTELNSNATPHLNFFGNFRK